jgi:hypothetical protein
MAGYTQQDLFGEVDAAEARQARIDAYFAELKLDCCTGELPVPGWVDDNYGDGRGHEYAQQRCPRCGELDSIGSLMVNHDRGWCGCPEDDATKVVTKGSAPNPAFRHLTDAQMRDRHDRVHHRDCVCGDPWGLHDDGHLPEESRCSMHCGCRGYRPV